MAGPGATPTAPPPLAGAALPLMTVTVAFATFMEVLDTSVANVSVPAIAGDLAVSPAQGTWVISSYSVASAIAVPLTGWLARRVGEVRLFLISVTLFTLMSMLCGLSTSLPMLVACRLLQGLCSGPMVPLSQTLLLKNYPAAKRGLALGLWSMTIVVAPVLGPMLGGWITENLSWPWIFYINVPIGIACVVTNAWLLLGRESETARGPIDAVGLALLVIGVGALQMMLDNGNDLDWFGSPVIVALAVTAAIALVVLVVWELTDPHPVVDLTLFALPNFRVGVIVLFTAFVIFFSTIVIIPLWLQTVMQYTSSWAGLATAPIGVLSLVLSPLIGRNLARLNLRLVLSFGFAVFAVVCLWSARFALNASFGEVVLPRLLTGVALACFFVPITSVVLSGIPPERVAAAAGLSNFLRTLGGAVGTAASVTLWNRLATAHHAVLSERTSTLDGGYRDYVDVLQGAGFADEPAARLFNQGVDAQSFMLATNDLFAWAALVFLALIPLVWLARPPFATSGTPSH